MIITSILAFVVTWFLGMAFIHAASKRGNYALYCLLVAFAAFMILVNVARGEEHIHGVTVPNWYDADCCNTKDCRPVPDEEIDFGLDEQARPMVVHKPTGIRFLKDKWKVSQDERFHVCYSTVEDYDGGNNNYNSYCVYLRAGV